MTITRVGTTKKYAEGWAAAFGATGKRRAANSAKKQTKKKTPAVASKKKKAAGRTMTAKPARK